MSVRIDDKNRNGDSIEIGRMGIGGTAFIRGRTNGRGDTLINAPISQVLAAVEETFDVACFPTGDLPEASRLGRGVVADGRAYFFNGLDNLDSTLRRIFAVRRFLVAEEAAESAAEKARVAPLVEALESVEDGDAVFIERAAALLAEKFDFTPKEG